jgi:hypothetical protein
MVRAIPLPRTAKGRRSGLRHVSSISTCSLADAHRGVFVQAVASDSASIAVSLGHGSRYPFDGSFGLIERCIPRKPGTDNPDPLPLVVP